MRSGWFRSNRPGRSRSPPTIPASLLDRGSASPLIEYPQPPKALAERIGTALINGSWFVRRLQHLADHAVIMHGHRHVDWIGECGGMLILSAPSPVMEATDCLETYFYVHTLGVARTDGSGCSNLSG